MSLPSCVILNYTPKQELFNRIHKFQKLLIKNCINGALIVQKADLFYFSGTCQNAHLFIPDEGEPLLMVKKSFERAQAESGINNIIPVQSLEEIPKNIFSQFKRLDKIGIEMDVLPANLYLKYKSAFQPSELVDVSMIIREIRSIKSTYELDKLKKAANLNFAMFSKVSSILKEGIREIDLAAQLEAVYRVGGHQGAIRMRAFNQEVYYGHILSGWNSAYPSFFGGPTGGTGVSPAYPQSAGFKTINKNEPIKVDYVGVCDGYMVDQARIFCIGNLPEKLIKAHEIAIKIKNHIIKETRPGMNGKDLYNMAYNIAVDSGNKDYFMGYTEDKINFIAHGIGVELDELPLITQSTDVTLKPGMVFAVEPSFIFPNEGAVGVEDTMVLTATGFEQITYFDDPITYS